MNDNVSNVYQLSHLDSSALHSTYEVGYTHTVNGVFTRVAAVQCLVKTHATAATQFCVVTSVAELHFKRTAWLL